MIISFEFDSAFAKTIGNDNYKVLVSGNQCALKKAFMLLCQQNPELSRNLEHKKMINDGKLFGLFVVDNSLVNEESILHDKACVRVFYPIAGG